MQAGSLLASLTGLALGTSANGGIATNYNVLSTTGSSVSITPADLVLSGTRVYDGTTVIDGSVLTATGVAGETFTVTGTGDATNLLSKDVQAGSLLASLTGLALGTSANGGIATNYNVLSTTGSSVSITPYVVSMTGARAYDGTVNADASIFTLGPLVGTETLTISGAGTVASQNVGTYSTTLGTLSLDTLALGDGTNGGIASNYTFTGGTQAVTIDPAQLYVAIVGNPTKVYDSTTDAILSSANFALTGFVAGEGGTVNTGTAGTYYTDVSLATPSKDVLTATTVAAALAPTDFTADPGTLLSNYILPTAAIGPGQITPYVVSMTGSRQYDGTTNVAGSMFTTSPGTMGTLVGTETLTLSGTGTLSSQDVGTYSTTLGTLTLGTLTLGDGTNGGLASNYTLVGGTQTATITPYVVKLYGSRNYDQTATVDASIFGTVYGVTFGPSGNTITETLTLTGSGTMADKNAGAGKPIASMGTLAISDGINLGSNYPWLVAGLASNYTLVGSTPFITVRPISLSVTGLTAMSKVYDGTTAAMLTGTATVSNSVLSGDDVSLAGTLTGVFANKNVGNGVHVILSGSNLSGADAGNYILQAPYLSANITKAPLTFTVGTLSANKVYDGTTIATISGITINGVVAGDAVSIAGTYNSPNVGTGLNVSVALTGNDAANYSYASLPVASLTGSITPRALTYTGTPVADNKVYDGTLLATVTGITGISGLVAGDVNDITVSGLFADKNVGTGKAVTLSLSGLKAANYTLPATGLTADITPATISSVTGFTASNKVYDATTTATFNANGAVFNGMISGDVLTVASATGAFALKNVGTNRPVNITGITLGGADAGNYVLALDTATAHADITPANLYVTGLTAANKVYDATTAATLTGTATISPLGSDAVTLGGSQVTAVFANKNAGNGKAVTVTGYKITGMDAVNYTLIQPTGLTANITQRALTYSGTPVVAPNKVYDGNTLISVSGASLNGVLGSDSVILTGLFTDPNVGINKPVSLGLVGADGGNYSITQPGGLTSSITPRPLVVTADNKTMMFGGTIPPLTYTVGGSGLVAADSISTVFTGALAVNTVGVNPGSTTPITQGTLALTTGPGGNYSISLFVDGLMTIQ